MIKSIILCEGSTDYVLLQYFMRRVHGWEDKRTNEKTKNRYLKRIRTLTKGEDRLSIGSCGGASGIIPSLGFVVEHNNLSAEQEAYDRIVILTDRDETQTETMFSQRIQDVLREKDVSFKEQHIVNNRWVECQFKNGHGKEGTFYLLMLVIPFEETGAMETFLLNTVAMGDDYDAEIIKKSKMFVDEIDPQKRNLSKKRYITKAEFDVYFSVRTAAEQFVERQNILKNVEWEKYAVLQKNFEKLGDLSDTEKVQ